MFALARVNLAVSHRVPAQVADRGLLTTYRVEGYRGNKLLGADQNSCCCPAVLIGTTGTRCMGTRQKNPWYGVTREANYVYLIV
jgi:hypothetical protein